MPCRSCNSITYGITTDCFLFDRFNTKASLNSRFSVGCEKSEKCKIS